MLGRGNFVSFSQSYDQNLPSISIEKLNEHYNKE